MADAEAEKLARREARRERRKARRRAERQLFEAWFQTLDPESKGLLEAAYIAKALKKYGYSDADIETLMKEAESRGVMDVKGFVKFMEEVEVDHEAARLRKEVKDKVGDELITLAYLEQLCQEHVPELPEDRLRAIAAELKNAEDKLKLEDFLAVLKKENLYAGE